MLFLSVTQQLQHIHRILGDSIIIPSPCISCVVLEIADCWISESTVQVAMQVMAPEDVLLTCYFFLFGRIVTKPWPLAMCQQKKMSSFSLAKLHFIAPFHVTFCKKNIVLKMKCSSNIFLYQNAGCHRQPLWWDVLPTCLWDLWDNLFAPGLQQLGGFLQACQGTERRRERLRIVWVLPRTYPETPTIDAWNSPPVFLEKIELLIEYQVLTSGPLEKIELLIDVDRVLVLRVVEGFLPLNSIENMFWMMLIKFTL